MRKVITLALAACVLPAAADARAGDADEARKVIDRAITAHGGEDRLARTRLHTRDAKGTIDPQGMAVAFTSQLTLALPDQLRETIEVGAGKAKLLRVINGEQGWEAPGGQAREMDKSRLQEVREAMYGLWLGTLLPLRDPAFELSTLPEARVNDRPAVGVKAARKGHPDVSLYFDQQTGLLAKVEYRGHTAGLPVNRAEVLTDYREFQGIRLPTKRAELINGMKSAELTVTGYDFPSKAEDGTFAKP